MLIFFCHANRDTLEIRLLSDIIFCIYVCIRMRVKSSDSFKKLLLEGPHVTQVENHNKANNKKSTHNNIQ